MVKLVETTYEQGIPEQISCAKLQLKEKYFQASVWIS
jgi:hypothetical protein